MKKSIATALLALAASPVFADGIYESVTAGRIADSNSISAPAEASPSPLYRQVTGDWMRVIDRESGRVNTMTEFSYSPLYLKVTGKMG